jgi:hypothetical protein
LHLLNTFSGFFSVLLGNPLSLGWVVLEETAGLSLGLAAQCMVFKEIVLWGNDECMGTGVLVENDD